MDELIKIISKSAPLLGGILAGSAGEKIGNLIASAFGGDINNPDDLAAKIKNDPEATLKLIELQYQNKVEIERLNLERIKTEISDSQDARKMSIRKAELGQKDYVTSFLACILTICVLLSTFYLFKYVVPQDNKELVVSLMNTINTVWVMVFGYYFGNIIKKDKNDK